MTLGIWEYAALDGRHAPESQGANLNATEAAEYARMTRKALYEAARRGLIPFSRVGRRLKFSRKALDAILAAR